MGVCTLHFWTQNINSGKQVIICMRPFNAFCCNQKCFGPCVSFHCLLVVCICAINNQLKFTIKLSEFFIALIHCNTAMQRWFFRVDLTGTNQQADCSPSLAFLVVSAFEKQHFQRRDALKNFSKTPRIAKASDWAGSLSWFYWPIKFADNMNNKFFLGPLCSVISTIKVCKLITSKESKGM